MSDAGSIGPPRGFFGYLGLWRLVMRALAAGLLVTAPMIAGLLQS